VRRRLLAIVVATTTLVVVAFVLPLAGLIRSVARDRAVSAAEHDSAGLAPVLAAPSDDRDVFVAQVTEGIERTDTGADDRLTVWLPDRTQLGDPTPADENAVRLARDQKLAFSQRDGDGLLLYTPVVTGTGETSVVRARLPGELLERGVTRAWAALATVGVALVALAAVIADRLGRSLTREATALAGTARTLAGGDPQARVTLGATPELADAGRALNLLADRIDELRAAERGRVADLSHRLRTPLTALRLDAEAAGDDDVSADVDRLEAAVTELIHAAQRPLHDGPLRPTCDLAAVVRERAEFWGALADDDGRTWQLDLPPAGPASSPVPVALDADEAGAAIDALLGNVFGHTPDGTAYRITLTMDGTDAGPATRRLRMPGGGAGADRHGAAQLVVDDAGPGIPDPETVLARGHSEGRSTGLGLDIARRAAEAAGGRLTIARSPLGGARVTLTFPASSPA
jgi:signal transduction histidine kinase